MSGNNLNVDLSIIFIVHYQRPVLNVFQFGKKERFVEGIICNDMQNKDYFQSTYNPYFLGECVNSRAGGAVDTK